MDNCNYELMEQLMRLQGLLSRYFHRNLREYGSRGVPYSGQGRVLKLLKIKPEIPQKELAEILGMRSQSIGELLSKLERKGYITRTPSSRDKRVVIVRLTEEGANANEWEENQPDSIDIFNSLSEEEQKILNGYLSRIIEDLEGRYGRERERLMRRKRGRGFSDFTQNGDGDLNEAQMERLHSHDRFFHI